MSLGADTTESEDDNHVNNVSNTQRRSIQRLLNSKIETKKDPKDDESKKRIKLL